MSSEIINLFKTVPVVQAQKNKTVEGQLWGTYRALAEAEGNVHFMSKLKTLGLATNDVRNFAEKQTIHKKLNKEIDFKVLKSAMRSKLSDACAFTKKLRQIKNTQKNRLTKKYQGNRSKGRRIIDDMVKRYRKLKILEFKEADKKIGLYMERSKV